MDTNNASAKEEKVYYDEDELREQSILWSEAEKKHPWYDAPPKVKVTTEKGVSHMKIELIVGLPPDGVYELFTKPKMISSVFKIGKRQLLESKSKKVLKKEGPREIAKVKNAVAWDFLWWSGTFPIDLIVDEYKKDLTAKYRKEKMMFMKVFEGNYRVEPLFVDSERFCKHRLPKTKEEYKKCSGGQGRIASKVIMDQYFQPCSIFSLPHRFLGTFVGSLSTPPKLCFECFNLHVRRSERFSEFSR